MGESNIDAPLIRMLIRARTNMGGTAFSLTWYGQDMIEDAILSRYGILHSLVGCEGLMPPLSAWYIRQRAPNCTPLSCNHGGKLRIILPYRNRDQKVLGSGQCPGKVSC